MSVNEMLMAAAGAGGPSEYVEDVFSTWLYTGTGASQTITNNVDLSTKGGLLWIKRRNGTGQHNLFDTNRGVTKYLVSNSTAAEGTLSDALTSFNSNGFTLGTDASGLQVNTNTETYASWTFRKAPKFFDVVTYTGNGTAGRTVAHNLGSVPGMIIVKCTSSSTFWAVYHRSNGATQYSILSNTTTPTTSSTMWNDTEPTSSVFSVGTASQVNSNGATYVAYLFAHNAGGFGAAGTDNIISCGSVTIPSSGDGVVSLGYEPQYILLKQTNSANNWWVYDTMRGIATGIAGGDLRLLPNLSNAEESGGSFNYIDVTSTGFNLIGSSLGANNTYIYMAIRRPMKVPTTGTEVFSPLAYTAPSSATLQTTNFPVDLIVTAARDASGGKPFVDRLRGSTTTTGVALTSTGTGAEYSNAPNSFGLDSNVGIIDNYSVGSGLSLINWTFRRAPGFFDVVCYTGNATAGKTVTHNLTVAPELMIVKSRNLITPWAVYHKNLTSALYYLNLNTANAQSTTNGVLYWNFTAPTASVFSVGEGTATNGSGSTYVAYLFATLAGVSKVGSYTGNGTSQTINCGFTAGARFVLIKRTNTTGDWYVWDTARGIVTGNDPHLSLNTTSTEVTTNDSIDPDNSGFIVNQLAATNINVNAATYIYLAIA